MATIDRYHAPADLPERIPLFPLRGAILLPRSELPLNVFEPRYLAMVDDAMSSHRVIGIIQPADSQANEFQLGEDGEKKSDRPVESPSGKAVSLKRVGCAGRITAYQELPDGRFRIVLTGIARFSMIQDLPTAKPYRLAAPDYAEFSDDLAADTTAESVDRDELMRVLKSYLTARNLDADWNAINRAPLEPLVNGLAAMSPFGPEEKQALLEARTLKERSSVLIALAQMAIAGGDTSAGGTLQ